MNPNEYIMLSSKYPDGLAQLVTSALNNGWHLHGQPFSHDGQLVQAVLRRTRPLPFGNGHAKGEGGQV